jgi:hypothetical protein
MTISYESNSDVMVYAFARIIAFSRSKAYIFAAHCVWWPASIIGFEQRLIIRIAYLRKREPIALESMTISSSVSNKVPESATIPSTVHPSQVQQMSIGREMPPTPWDLTEEQRTEQLLDRAEHFIEECKRAQITWQRNRFNSLPQTHAQLKKARKIKRLQEAGKKR